MFARSPGFIQVMMMEHAGHKHRPGGKPLVLNSVQPGKEFPYANLWVPIVFQIAFSIHCQRVDGVCPRSGRVFWG